MSFIVRYSKTEDLCAIAESYRKAFASSLSTSLGQLYVERTLEWFLSSDQNFLFHVEENGTNRVVGFCGGMLNNGVNPRGSASEMIQFAFRQGVIAFSRRPWLLFHSEMRAKYGLAWKNVKKKMFKQKNVNYEPGAVAPFCGLVVIGVSPEFQNNGFGAVLLSEFERKAGELGFYRLKLSVKADNAQAIRVYEKNGWAQVHVKSKSVQMQKLLI
jgi:ribosomal protein S18 acetylase RimI-like enzyme